MSTQIFALVSLAGAMSYGQQTTRRIAKECASVSEETIAEIRGRAESTDRDRTHGQVLYYVRELTKTAAIPDKCVAAIVDAVMTERGTAQGQQHVARAQAAQQAWDQLTLPQQVWVATRKLAKQDPVLVPDAIVVGAIGAFREDVYVVTVSIISETEAVVSIGRKNSYETASAWLAGISTTHMVTGEKYEPPKGVFWVPNTVTYPAASGGENTVYLMEPVQGDFGALRNLEPPANFLETIKTFRSTLPKRIDDKRDEEESLRQQRGLGGP